MQTFIDIFATIGRGMLGLIVVLSVVGILMSFDLFKALLSLFFFLTVCFIIGSYIL